MKKYGQFIVGIVLVAGLFLVGCSADNSSSPTAANTVSAAGQIEGQLVANAGTNWAAKVTSDLIQATTTAPVYPVSGVTVELVRNGSVVATTTTDVYGRFRFLNVAPGEYDVRMTSASGAVIHSHVTVNADQTISVYGRVMSGDCAWDYEPGSHWDDMPGGPHWGTGYCGASPGAGYWHDGHGWQGR